MPPGLNNPLQVFNPLQALQPGYTDPAPQPGETPFAYQHRMAVLANARRVDNAVSNIIPDVKKAADYLFGNEAQNQQKATKPAAATRVKPASVFPESFMDPVYDRAITNASKITGVPADLLTSVLRRGERSNASEVSPDGARTPFQIIPETRAGIQRNYHIDPWSNPDNAALGAAYVLREQAGGRGQNAPNWNDPMIRLRAVGGYFAGGRGAADPTSEDLRDVNMSVGEYTRRVLGRDLVNGFDPAYADAAHAQIEQARLGQKPETFAFNAGPMPEIPQPQPVPKTDFSVAESQLETLRPVEWTLKEAENARWKNFWGGLGQAMMNSPEGEGLGSFFLRLGGAGLASVGQTRDEVQQRKDIFETKMAKYNAALYEHDLNKAQIMQRELMADWQNNQNYALQQYEQGMQLWNKNAFSSQIVGDRLVTQTADKNGNVQVHMTPIQGIIDAAAAKEHADVYLRMFGAENESNAQVARAINGTQTAILTAQIGQMLADDNVSPQEKAAADAYAKMLPINNLVESRNISSFLGEEEFEFINERIMRELTPVIRPGDKGFLDEYKKALKLNLLEYMNKNPDEYRRLVETVGAASSIFELSEQYGSRVYQRNVNSRGQVSEQVKMGGE